MNAFRPIQVLLVEDNPGDAELTRDALESHKLLLDLTVAPDGVAALEHLRGGGTPDLILLDLNLPRKNGREVLAEIREDPAFKHIPVVVLTSSSSENDVVGSYRLGANCYVTKPVDFEGFQSIVSEVAEFWFTVVRLP